MDKALRYELNAIPEIQNKIYPVHAPEGKKPPYLVYMKSYFRQLKTFDGLKKEHEATYLLNILCDSYAETQVLTKKVKDKIKTFPLRTVGNDGIYVQEITFNNVSDTYENELGLHRSIIEVTIYYKRSDE